MNENAPKMEDGPASDGLSLSASCFSVLLCMLFGANAVAIKMSLAGLGPFTTAGIRFLMASVVIFLWARLTGRSFYLKPGQIRQMSIVSVVFIVQLSLLYTGLSKTYASRGTLIINLLPFFVLIAAHIFLPGDRITRRKVLGLLLGFSGVALVLGPKTSGPGDFLTGDLMILAATVIWSGNTVYTKKIIHNFQAFHIVFYQMVFSTPLFFLLGWLLDSPMVGNVDARVVGAMCYQGFVTASVGFVAWNTMLQRHGASALHTFVFIMPITGVALGGLVLSEPISGNILLALVLVASGILVVHLKAGMIGLRYFFGKNI